jgi:hypothetical protein
MIARPIPIASRAIAIRMTLPWFRSARFDFLAELFTRVADIARIFPQDFTVSSRSSHVHLGVNVASS